VGVWGLRPGPDPPDPPEDAGVLPVGGTFSTGMAAKFPLVPPRLSGGGGRVRVGGVWVCGSGGG
jgi:hypothetical protein